MLCENQSEQQKTLGVVHILFLDKLTMKWCWGGQTLVHTRGSERKTRASLGPPKTWSQVDGPEILLGEPQK